MKRNTDGLKQAAKRKSNGCFSRTLSAIDCLKKQGEDVTFSAVMQKANVSRAYLYGNSYLSDLIRSSRDERGTDNKESPQAQIDAYRIEIRRLKAEIERLKKKEIQCQTLQKENEELKEQLKTAYQY